VHTTGLYTSQLGKSGILRYTQYVQFHLTPTPDRTQAKDHPKNNVFWAVEHRDTGVLMNESVHDSS
jgi:hypothetical protein